MAYMETFDCIMAALWVLHGCPFFLLIVMYVAFMAIEVLK